MQIKTAKVLLFIKTGWSLFLLLLILPLLQSFSFAQEYNIPPSVQNPLEVAVTLRINKIYNINSVNETYQIDGYLLYTWVDERFKFDPGDSLEDPKLFENDRAKELMNTNLWTPAFELINVQSSKETPNTMIEIHSNGTIEYEERFFGTFSSNMDYKKFPFDTQEYLVAIEAFSYDSEKLVFKDPKLFFEGENYDYLGEDWEFICAINKIELKNYEYLNDEKSSFSRVIFGVKAKRKSGYYQWQVLFPLLIIILASFVIFWIKEFSSQIGVGFTLMLTVVAFNFYSASILPKLPYNTFIEYVILIGYIFIFLGIVAVVINHRINPAMHKKDKIPLLKYFKYAFPLTYAIIMTILYLNFIVF